MKLCHFLCLQTTYFIVASVLYRNFNFYIHKFNMICCMRNCYFSFVITQVNEIIFSQVSHFIMICMRNCYFFSVIYYKASKENYNFRIYHSYDVHPPHRHTHTHIYYKNNYSNSFHQQRRRRRPIRPFSHRHTHTHTHILCMHACMHVRCTIAPNTIFFHLTIS